MIDIRKASLEDYDTIHSLAQRTWYPTYLPILSREQLDYMLEMMYSQKAVTEQISINGHHFLLANEGAEFLGFASYEVNYHSETTKLHKLYVLPESQGKGVGARLLSIIESEARRNHNDKLILNVNRYNPAVHFYRKSGFEQVGEEDIDIGNGYLMEDYIMAKNL